MTTNKDDGLQDAQYHLVCVRRMFSSTTRRIVQLGANDENPQSNAG